MPHTQTLGGREGERRSNSEGAVDTGLRRCGVRGEAVLYVLLSSLPVTKSVARIAHPFLFVLSQ